MKIFLVALLLFISPAGFAETKTLLCIVEEAAAISNDDYGNVSSHASGVRGKYILREVKETDKIKNLFGNVEYGDHAFFAFGLGTLVYACGKWEENDSSLSCRGANHVGSNVEYNVNTQKFMMSSVLLSVNNVIGVLKYGQCSEI